MKTFHKTCLAIAFMFFSITAMAQTDEAKKLVKEGIALHDAQKYTEAVDKYKQAINLDPKYTNAYYEMGYTLFISDKRKEAIPVLEKLLELDSYAGGGYDLLGTIYDDDKQPEKAIEYYKKGVEKDPNYQRLHYNLAITYYRIGKYAEAEPYAVTAIKLDPKHASSMRVYAMATYKAQKRDCSLLAWCSFIMKEPQTARSVEAYKYIRTILNFGITKTSEKSINLSIPSNDAGGSTMMMQMAVLAATSDKKNLSTADSLSLQLKSVFKILGETSTKKSDTFYVNYLAKYFDSLAQTDNMPAFGRLMSLAALPEDNKAWFKEHDKELTNLSSWIQTTERNF